MTRIHNGTVPLVLLALGAVVAFGVLAVQDPVWAVVVIGGAVAAVSVGYGGVWAGSVSAAVAVLGMSGFIAAHVPRLGIASEAAQAYLAALGLAYGLSLITRRRLQSKLIFPVAGYLFICGAVAFATILISPLLAARGFLALVFPVLVTLAIVGVLRRHTGASEQRKRRLLTLTVVGVFVANIVVALRQAFIGFTGPELTLIDRSVSTHGIDGTIRSMGLLPTNQDFGFLVACLTPAALVAATQLPRRPRIAVLIIGIIGVVALLTSLTRTSLVAATVALLLGLFAWGRGTTLGRVAKYTALTGGLSAAVWWWLSASSSTRAQETRDRILTLTDLSQDRSFQDRSGDVYPRAIAAINENLLGAGAGSAGPVSQRYPSLAPYGSLTTDNGYLMIAVQIGVIGALVFTFMLWATIRALTAHVDAYRAAAATAVLSLAVAFISAQYWSLSAPAAVVAAVVGLGFGNPQRAHHRISPPARSQASV
ncbi:O-antigen ligase family protein [Kocuria sp. NPDC057446]|uniref:O-antigen ligase family protein n=1 Tax=Kocuria sp. NPDC057446 TaxID=3346137 RepID=UPI003685BE10